MFSQERDMCRDRQQSVTGASEHGLSARMSRRSTHVARSYALGDVARAGIALSSIAPLLLFLLVLLAGCASPGSDGPLPTFVGKRAFEGEGLYCRFIDGTERDVIEVSRRLPSVPFTLTVANGTSRKLFLLDPELRGYRCVEWQ